MRKGSTERCKKNRAEKNRFLLDHIEEFNPEVSLSFILIWRPNSEFARSEGSYYVTL